MFDYNNENETFDKLVGSNVRRDDGVFIGVIVGIDHTVDGHNHQNSVAVIHRNIGLDNPVFNEDGSPYTFKMNCRALIASPEDVTDTKTVTYWADDDMPLSFKDEIEEKIKFSGEMTGGNRFAYVPERVVDGKVIEKKRARSKSSDFMVGIEEVISL